MATSFQECVAMDLKFYNRNIILYLVDNATRLSSSDIIKSEKPNEIIDNIFKIWIRNLWSTRKIFNREWR